MNKTGFDEVEVEQKLEQLINFSNDLVLKGTFDHFQLHQIGTVDPDLILDEWIKT